MSAIRSALRTLFAIISSVTIYFLLFFASLFIVTSLLTLLLSVPFIDRIMNWLIYLIDKYLVDDIGVFCICGGIASVLSKMFLDWFMRRSSDLPYNICRIAISAIVALFGIGFAFTENGKYLLHSIGMIAGVLIVFKSAREFAVPREEIHPEAAVESNN